MNSLCCIFNYPSHYRYLIYKKIGEELDADFIFGDKLPFDLKSFKVSELGGFKFFLKNKFFCGFNYQKKLIRFFLTSRYNTYIVTGDLRNISLWICLLLSQINKKQIILWSHGYNGKENFVTSKLKNIFFGMSYHTLTYGDTAKNIMIKNGFSKNKVSTIYNSLDYYKQLDLRNIIQSSNIYKDYFMNDYPTISFIGRLNYEKRIDLLIEAIELLRKENNYFNLALIGKDGSNGALINKVKELGISDYVWFYGECYDEQLTSRLIYDSAFCVSPGDTGLTVIHSLMFGTPVITHDNMSNHGPEVESIKNRQTGLFFKENDLKSLCQAIIEAKKLFIPKTNYLRDACFDIVDKYYNPDYQIKVLRDILNR